MVLQSSFIVVQINCLLYKGKKVWKDHEGEQMMIELSFCVSYYLLKAKKKKSRDRQTVKSGIFVGLKNVCKCYVEPSSRICMY